jgi:diadenylate cyclase
VDTVSTSASPLQSALGEIQLDSSGTNARVLVSVAELAIEIAREGREGRKIGTIFTIGAEDEVLQRSEVLILDPLSGHPSERRSIEDPDLRETVKELAQLDGGFIVSGDGEVLSACRYFEAQLSGIKQPLGLGSRHIAAASISAATGAIAIVVSESSIVRIYAGGRLVKEILPEVWLLHRHMSRITAPSLTKDDTENLAILGT